MAQREAQGAWRAGASELRTIDPDEPDFRALMEIVFDAYPGMRVAPDERDAYAGRVSAGLRGNPSRRCVGAYREGRLAGGMQLWDFTMRFRDTEAATGGLGTVAVGFEHKRRGVARDLVCGYLDWYAARGTAFGALYPFRPSFYRALGFGYGTKMSRYRLRLEALPDGPRECVSPAAAADAPALAACYERVFARTHGFMRKPAAAFERLLAEPDVRAFAYRGDDRSVRGYLTFAVTLADGDLANRNGLDVREFVYETPAAFGGLLAFLGAQQDQFAFADLTTQDPDFHFAPSDPRDGSDRNLAMPAAHRTNAQGIGIMYRTIAADAAADALARCTFGALNAVVRFHVSDALVAANDGPRAFRFEDGRATPVSAPRRADIEITLDAAEYAALVMGCVRLRSLVDYGRAAIAGTCSPEAVDRALAVEPPRCLTRF